MKNLNFVIPFFFESAPRSSVMLQGEVRTIKNENHPDFGKVSIYTDSHFNPLNVGKMDFDSAKKLVVCNGGIWVKQGFDILNVDHLREIKSELSEDWIKGFNEWYNAPS